MNNKFLLYRLVWKIRNAKHHPHMENLPQKDIGGPHDFHQKDANKAYDSIFRIPCLHDSHKSF